MWQILSKPNPNDVELELDKLQSEMLARGGWPLVLSVCYRLTVVNMILTVTWYCGILNSWTVLFSVAKMY